jgi:uncharacterized protein (DUF2384 family)
VNAEDLLVLLGWIPQEQWARQAVDNLVDDLGAWADDKETRRWFRKPQPTLGRRTPLEALRLARSPGDPLLTELRRLAQEPAPQA